MTVSGPPPLPERSSRWLSQGLERLLHDVAGRRAERDPQRPSADFDVVIVGSGYGGALAAARLAVFREANALGLRICVLERGREYLPGAFPDRLADLGGHVRFTAPGHVGARGRLGGLFDLRMGGDVSVLLANGLGGGSLINAGVMEFPRASVFADSRWPRTARGARDGAPAVAFPDYDALSSAATRCRIELGAASAQGRNTVGPGTFAQPLKRVAAMTRLGARPVPITVALEEGRVTSGHVALDKCIACGDCATGCNHGAKESLDTNLLVTARDRDVAIYTGATVDRIERAPAGAEGWTLRVWHTDPALRDRSAGALLLTAGKVVLAAGALGSTEILLRSRSDALRFSSRLGQGFSGNGDVLVAAFDARGELGGVAREAVPFGQRQVGPTITSMLDLRDKDGCDFVVQDLGVPAAFRRIFEEATATAATLDGLARADTSVHSADPHAPDPCAVDPAKVDRSMAMAVICRDSATGVISAIADDGPRPRDAGVHIAWASAKDDLRLDAAVDEVQRRVAKAFDARLLPNPGWRPLPAALANTLRAKRGPLTSVHPLGGCGMGDDRARGVVNGIGEVFDGDPARGPADVHPGLVVLDGATVPTSLGINPALTITTLADHALGHLLPLWFPPAGGATVPAGAKGPSKRRPVLREVRDLPPKPVETEVQLVEKLSGGCELGGQPVWIELSLLYDTTRLHPPSVPMLDGHRLQVAPHPTLSRVRVFARPQNPFAEPAADVEALFVAPVTGHLRFFHREPSTAAERQDRAWSAWLANRGVRDAAQSFVDGTQSRLDALKAWFMGRSEKGDTAPGECLLERYRRMREVATVAGEVRLFDYELHVGPATVASAPFDDLRKPGAIKGVKRIAYARRASPWTQLMRLELTEFLGLDLAEGKRCIEVDPVYFAKQQVPLARIVQQQDQPSALVDILAFGLYAARILLTIHFLSFRKPDATEGRQPDRRPAVLAGLPKPETFEVKPCAPHASKLLLTRYQRAQAAGGSVGGPPVLLIHGYTANGATFAHPTLPEGGLAGFLAKRGFGVWVVDLRSSSAMPTAEVAWRFEDIALHDLPAAVARVCEEAKVGAIDVVSHCMGSAMLAMAMLAPDPRSHKIESNVRRWVMSQVGPALRFSPANTLRAFLVRYVQALLPGLKYELTPTGEAAEGGAQLFDRLLSSLPYLNDEGGSEYDIENPPSSWLGKRTPWARTRHRLDALIGRTFDARRLSEPTLRCIDDFFGPTSLVTLSQPIHFARRGFITGEAGLKNWGYGEVARRMGAKRDGGAIPMLSLHGADNGLADPWTLAAMADLAAKKSLDWRGLLLGPGDPRKPTGPALPSDPLLPKLAKPLAHGFGHQDSLIGKDSDIVFKLIQDFLSATPAAAAAPAAAPAVAPAPAALADLDGLAAALAPAEYTAKPPTLNATLLPDVAPPTAVARTRPDGDCVGAVVFPVLRDGADGHWVLTADGLTNARWFPVDALAEPKADSLRCEWTLGASGGAGDGDGDMVLFLFHSQPHTIFGTHLQAFVRIDTGPLVAFGAGLENARAGLATNVPEAALPNVDPPSAALEAIETLLARRSADSLEGAVIRRALSGPSGAGAGAAQAITGPPPLRFALCACQYPPGLLDGTPTRDGVTAEPCGPADRSLKRLHELAPRPERLIAMGDQIYIDATAGLFDPRLRDAPLDAAYEKRAANPWWAAITANVPTIALMDDHEVHDNWEPSRDPAHNASRPGRMGSAEMMTLGRAAFLREQRPGQPAGADLWYATDLGAHRLFVGDTRTRRMARSPRNLGRAGIMDKGQARALSKFLRQAGTTQFKFVATPSLVLPRRLATRDATRHGGLGSIESDAWDGYPASLHRLLGCIAEEAIENVVFLSGDEHIGMVTTITLRPEGGQAVTAWSIHAGALYAPYPFANAASHDFAHAERFEFRSARGTQVACEVSTWFPDCGDGFCTVDVSAPVGAAALRVTYHPADGSALRCWPPAAPGSP